MSAKIEFIYYFLGEEEDQVKSVRPLWTGLHTYYSENYKELR